MSFSLGRGLESLLLSFGLDEEIDFVVNRARRFFCGNLGPRKLGPLNRLQRPEFLGIKLSLWGLTLVGCAECDPFFQYGDFGGREFLLGGHF